MRAQADTTGPTALSERWGRMGDRLDVDPAAWARALDDLTARYSAAERHFHNLDHIEEVLSVIAWLIEQGESPEDRTAVELAACYHDAVYQPGARDNEARSAEVADTALRPIGVDPARIALVMRLIMATQYHIPDSADAAVLVDADLWILASPSERYRSYAGAIRAEYAGIGEEEFRRGRAGLLRELMERPMLFHTAAMRRQAEARARTNVEAEIAQLTTGA